MGLLDRVLTVPPVNREEERINREHLITEKLDSLSSFLPEDKSGLDFSGRFLDQLTKALNIDKAAFLLADDNSSWYIPWASLGFDKTTRNRLRLPFYSKEDFGKNKYLVFSNDTKEELKAYLSQREYSLNESLYFFPFSDEKSIFGGLLISSLPYKKSEQKTLLESIARFCRSFSRYMIQLQTRIRKTSGDHQVELLSENPVSDLTSYISGSEKTNTEIKDWLLVRFDLKPFLDKFAELSPGSDLLRIKTDCLGLFSRFCRNKGKLWETRDRNKLIYCVPLIQIDDPDLFLHQLKASFKTFFKNSEKIPLLKTSYELWSGGNQSIFSGMVNSLIS